MSFNRLLLSGSGSRRRGSVFLVSLILVLVAGTAVIGWMGYITETQRQANRDQARVHAFYAAEAGLDQVVDFFNNPGRGFVDNPLPSNYELEGGVEPEPTTSPYGLPIDQFGVPFTEYDGYLYKMFEPYVLGVAVNAAGEVLRDANGHPIPSRVTYLDENDVSKIVSANLKVPGRLKQYNSDGSVRAQVTKLMIVNPGDLDESEQPDDETVIAKIICSATAPELDGAEITLEMQVRQNPFVFFYSPGALLSQQSGHFNGQFNVHWGDVWTEADLELFNNWWKGGNTYIPNHAQDPWLNIMTNGKLMYKYKEQNVDKTSYPDGLSTANPKGHSSTSIPEGAENYHQPYIVTNSTTQNEFADYTNIYQHMELQFPEYPYEQIKQAFLTSGLPYYYTDESGNLYGEENGVIVKKTYDEWFQTTIDPNDQDSIDEYWDEQNMMAFIDSVPVNDEGETLYDAQGNIVVNAEYYPRSPDDPAYKKADIRSSGGGNDTHTHGAMFIVGDIYFGGQGKGTSPDNIVTEVGGDTYVAAPDPDYEPEPEYTEHPKKNSWKVNHNGFLYTYGTFDNSGEMVIYGSVHAKGGFGVSGSREIWYNYRLKEGSFLSPNVSAVMRTGWAIRRAALPEIG